MTLNTLNARRLLSIAMAVAVAMAVLVSTSGSVAEPRPVSKPGQMQEVSGGSADINIVMLFDGLRPDLVNPEDTPNLYRLQQSGVTFANSHAVVPTVTRANSPSLTTGSFPSTTGLMGNSIYAPAVDPDSPISTGDANNMIALGEQTGSVLLTDTSAARLERIGKRVVTIGSGTSGSAYLLNPLLPGADGPGVMINVGDPTLQTPLAIPELHGETIQERFGPPPTKDDKPNSNDSVDYMTEVFTHYVLPDLAPDLAYVWFTEPDRTQHAFGAGSPEAEDVIRNDDRNVGLILERLQELDLDANFFVTSDHGFSLTTGGVNLRQDLIDAGLSSPDSTDVVVAHTGVGHIYVERRNHQRIREIVAWLQEQEWAEAIFTAARQPTGAGRYRTPRPGATLDDIAEGWVEGTFSLELIHADNPERGPDIYVTFPWSSESNAFGIPGTATYATGGVTGPRTGPASNHGSHSPWDVRNTLFASGPDFKEGITSQVPAGIVDISPTLLALLGVDDAELAEMDGRTLVEAINEGPDHEKVPFETRTFIVHEPYPAAVQVSIVGDTRYVDTSWRLP